MKLKAIKENHLYVKAYQKGKRFVTRAIAVYVLPDYRAKSIMNAHPMRLLQNRIGLTVTKKVGGAVIRSRVRRILREGYRSVAAREKIKCGYLIVISARESAADKKSTDIARDLSYALHKLGMIET